MRRRVLLLTFSCLPVLLVLAAARAEACTCMGSGTPCQAFGRSTAVFVGTVTDIRSRPHTAGEEPDWGPLKVTFSVSEAFSGVEGVEAQVSTGMGGGDCGYSFVKGVSYIVYAYRMRGGDGKRLGTGICTRTQLAFGATEDLAFLRGLVRKPGGVTVSGRVERQQREPGEGGANANVGVEGMRVTVAGAGGEQEAVTDAQGRYSLTGLPPGEHEVTLHLPETMTAYEPMRRVTVADRGCATASFFVTDNGRIAGRVLDATGNPVPRVNVVVVDAEGKNPEFKYGSHKSTDEEGLFQFTGLPPGRYLLGVHIAGFPQPDDPTNAYARTYYPGVARREEAEVLELKAGEELKGRDLRLPPRRAEAVISGRVTWTDGSPVVNAIVAYRDVTYADTKVNNPIFADERGEFTLKTYVGAVYRIEVRSNRPFQGDVRRDGPMEEAPTLTVTAAAPVETVTISIKKLR